MIQNRVGSKSFLWHKQLNYDITANLQICVNTYVNLAELGTNQSWIPCLSCCWKELVFLHVLRRKARTRFSIFHATRSTDICTDTLKGHCHAIWQLYKKQVSSHQLNSKTNDLVLLLKTIWRYWNGFLSPVAMDGNGLKLAKVGHFFRVLILPVPKIVKTLIMVALSDKIHLLSSS